MNLVGQKITPIKGYVIEMMNLVLNQVRKCERSLLNFDKDLAEDIIFREKKINNIDLKIDDECEKVIALHTPVASDLRFVLSSLKINTFLERVGDNAEAIAHISNELTRPLAEEDVTDFQVKELFKLLDTMLINAIKSFEEEDTVLAVKIFKLDKEVDKINSKANELMVERVKKNSAEAKHYLDILSVIRKLERVGDLTKNIAEETIFYVDAKVLKHNKKKQAKLISKQKSKP